MGRVNQDKKNISSNAYGAGAREDLSAIVVANGHDGSEWLLTSLLHFGFQHLCREIGCMVCNDKRPFPSVCPYIHTCIHTCLHTLKRNNLIAGTQEVTT